MQKGLSQGLSNYYNSPGRLAVFRWQFGMDPATFATQLDPGSQRIRGHGQVRPKLDGQGPVHCSPTELWVVKTP